MENVPKFVVESVDESENRESLSPIDDHNLYLFEEGDDGTRPRVASLLSRLVNYDDAIPAAPADEAPRPVQARADLGALSGVYLPCIQNIFGVIIFIRMAWMTATAGVPLFFAIVLLCCCVTFTTSISLSAIATNGIVPAGGSYFMISRSLGPEFGGAVGILFFLGTCVAGAMYITGAVEIMLNYLSPQMGLYGDFRVSNAVMYNNIRTWGTVFLGVIGLLVIIGVRFVSKFAPIALICVLLSILSIYIGIFLNYAGLDTFKICVLGDRLLSQVANCSKVLLEPLFCSPPNRSECAYFHAHAVREELAIPGLSSGVLWSNIGDAFRTNGDLISTRVERIDQSNTEFVFVDISTSFTILVAIYFPSCTGILAGSNRSGDLKDPQRSIPLGTIAAQLTTTFVYLSVVILFGASFNPLFIRDKFGKSLGGALAATLISWPHPMIILLGALLSTFGASLQSLVGAPRLLQAIAKDNVIPFLEPFERVSARGEPMRAILVSLAIAECAILIGNLDFIAPVLTMFFLMCYLFLNLSTTIQSLLRTPSWRPRFRYFHWSISMSGIVLCLLVMFLSSWVFALCAMLLAATIYKYIEYRGAEKEWGDGIRGLALSAARYSLLRLEEGPPHTKLWRPQLLVLMKMKESFELKTPKLLSLASQLKAGKGLVIVATVIEGQFTLDSAAARTAKQSLRAGMAKEKVKGFAEAVVSRDVSEGLSHLIQTSGLGGLKHNTIVVAWPIGWRHSADRDKHCRFLSLIRESVAARVALLVVKGVHQWPHIEDRYGGTIDVWWIVHDGGLLMLVAHVLRLHRTWRMTRLRVFTVATIHDNSVQMKRDLTLFLYHLRIETAAVEVIEMTDCDVSAYTYERTLMMEQRTHVLSTTAVGTELVPIATTTPVADELNVRRMHTAVRLNELIVQRSHDAKLVIINMPQPTKSPETNYMEFLEVLTEGLDRVLLARGAGREVITIFS